MGRTTVDGYCESLDGVIVALCSDYPRRAEALAAGTGERLTLMEYKYLNYKMAEGAAEIVGERFAIPYITEIGRRIGYASSVADCISETTYKLKKLEVKLNIARKLHLLD